MSIVQDVAKKALETGLQMVPARWLPGGVPDPLAAKHGLIGAPVSRIDGPLKVAGQARFAGEVPMNGLLYAALVYGTIARGRIVAIDRATAEAAPGVALVMTHENAPPMKEPELFGSSGNAASQIALPVLQNAEVYWNGQPIAVVLADSQEQADHAATLVAVNYEEDPATLAFADAKGHAHEPPNIMGEPSSIAVGDAEAELARAFASVDIHYRTPRHNHNAIQPHAITCAWEGETLTIHDASQLVTATARTLEQMFGLEKDAVRVISPYVGGGFGSKCFWWHQALGAAAAKLARRPVRLVLSREGVYRVVGGRTQTEQRVALGAREDGTLTALIHTGVVPMSFHNQCPEQFSFPARHMYAADTFKIVQQVAEMDMLANTFMRAPGESIGTYALECAIDELAEKLGIDPVELRERMEPEKDPTSGHDFSSRHHVEAFRAGAERFGWSEREPEPQARREGEWWIGMGCAAGTYPYYRMPGGSARITIKADGKATVAAAAHEMGMGTSTVQTQICAERLGLAFEDVAFEHGDTLLPTSPVAGGSNQTAAIASAVIAAQGKLITELLKLAGNDSPLAGLSVDEVEGANGGLAKIGEPGRHESYASILSRAGRAEVTVEAPAPPPLETMRWSMHSTSAIFAEVAVSSVTGEVRVRRLLGSFDCGRILNAKTAASQFRGGMIMGLGLALTEETLFDERTGRVMNPSLAEYYVPVHLDVPKIEVLWTDIVDPRTPMGARGIGEIGITGVGAAVANAVYNACGVRVRDLPITLDKVMGD
jgi:xanthine dehydrogenase YagR molybdenum-binding subunit